VTFLPLFDLAKLVDGRPSDTTIKVVEQRVILKLLSYNEPNGSKLQQRDGTGNIFQKS
jgi:hypothetical protein